MGSRSCVGRNLALGEVHKYIAQFFRHFDEEIVNKDRPWVTKPQARHLSSPSIAHLGADYFN